MSAHLRIGLILVVSTCARINEPSPTDGGEATAGGASGGGSTAGGSASSGGTAADGGRPFGRDAQGNVQLPDGGLCQGLAGGGPCCAGLITDEFINDSSCRLDSCRPLGGQCGASQCCSGLTCTAGRCVAAGACTPAGGLCTTNELDTCCPGAICVIDWLDVPRCFQRPSDWLCGPYVMSAARMACRTDADCCAQSCDAGVCVGPLR